MRQVQLDGTTASKAAPGLNSVSVACFLRCQLILPSAATLASLLYNRGNLSIASRCSPLCHTTCHDNPLFAFLTHEMTRIIAVSVISALYSGGQMPFGSPLTTVSLRPTVQILFGILSSTCNIPF